jgi:transcription elongation factor Elf1
MSKPWKDLKHKKEQKVLPAFKGLIACNKGHLMTVFDLNPERIVMNCSVCGDYLSIAKGIKDAQ